MIDKIKAEIKFTKEERMDGANLAFHQCLKWAEELEEELKRPIKIELSYAGKLYTHHARHMRLVLTEILKKIEKAFHKESEGK